jgi:hypothetical protein
LGVAAFSCCGCGTSSTAAERAHVERYLAEVEPIRRSVNKLLEGADPILEGFAKHRVSRATTTRRMSALEGRFATYAVEIAGVNPADDELRSLNAPYAETYVLEDSYLAALAAGISSGNLRDLPDTQNAQRAAIVRWRTRLTVLADRVHARLPLDLQQAGRGEIAPSPFGS